MSSDAPGSDTPRTDVREHTEALGRASYKLEELAAAFDDAATRAENAERELAGLRAFASAISRMVSPGPWDLRDSPKSLMFHVERMCNELDAAMKGKT